MTNPPFDANAAVEILTGTLRIGQASCSFRIDRHPDNKAYAVVETSRRRARIESTWEEVDAVVRSAFLEMIRRDKEA